MTRRKSKGGFLNLLGNGLLLLCALVGLLRTFLSLYPDVLEQFQIVVISSSSIRSSAYTATPAALETAVQYLTILAIFLAVVVLVIWSLPRFRLPAAAFYAVLLMAAILRYRTYLPDGAKLIYRSIANMFAERVGWISAVSFTFDLSAKDHLAAVFLFLAVALAALALLLGWAIIRGRRWWLVLLLTLPLLLPGLLADLYPDWRFFVILAACWCSMIFASLCRRAVPAGRGAVTILALPLTGLLLTAILLTIPQETYAYPEWAGNANTALTNFINRCFPSEEPVLEGPVPGSTFVGSADSVDLSSAGPLNYSGRNVLRVSADYTGRLYLRGASLTRYTGFSWEPSESGAYSSYMEPYKEEWGDRWVSVSPLLYPALINKDGKAHTFTVQNIGASTAAIYLPYPLASQELSEVASTEDVSFYSPTGRRSHTVTFLPDLLDLATVTPDASTNTLRTEQAYETFAAEEYLHLRLSPALEGVLTALIEPYRSSVNINQNYPHLSIEAAERLAKAELVADILADLCEYDPDTPVTPDGNDFVGYFLTESHRGYCMHFASAATLMLRYLDVPARYVSGFVADVQRGRMITVPDYNAHAWVEIYLPNYGWYPVEVTPGYEGNGNPAAPFIEEPPSPEPSPGETPSESPTPTPVPSATATPSPTKPSASPSPSPSLTLEPNLWQKILSTILGVLKWVGVAAAFTLAVWLGQYLPKRYRKKRLNSPDVNRAVLNGYHYLLRLARWGGQMEPYVLELAQKARFSQHTLTDEERRLVVSLFHEERRRIPEGLSFVKKLLFRYLWGIPR